MENCPPHPFGTVPLFGDRLSLTGLSGRLFDRFLYAGVFDGQPVLVHEYAPQGLVTRADRSAIAVIPPQHESLYAEERERFLAMAVSWQATAAKAGDALNVARVQAVQPGGNSVWVVTDHPGQRLIDAPPVDLTQVSAELATALSTVFASGLSLGNICPDTVFRRDGRILFAGPSPDSRALIKALDTAQFAGPAGYGAPELFDGMKRAAIGREADLFAATALIFRLYAGRNPADIRTQDLASDIAAALSSGQPLTDQVREALRLGLAVSRKTRGENINAWFERLRPPPAPKPPSAVIAAPVTAAPAPDIVPLVTPAQAVPPVPALSKPPSRSAGLIAMAIAVPVALLVLVFGFNGLKTFMAASRERATTEAVAQCHKSVSGKRPSAQSDCLKALGKISDAASQDYYDVSYDLGTLCETRKLCQAGKSAVDYYIQAAGDKLTATGKRANYKVAKLSPGLSLAEAHDYYAPAAGMLKKIDKAFTQSNKDVYADANYQIGLIFEKWSQKESFDPEEAKRLSPGSSRGPQKIALISAINRFEVAKDYGIDADSHLLDLYLQRGNSDAAGAQYESALGAYKKAGILGSAEANFKAAELFFAGNVTSMQQAEALDLLNSAANDDNIDALHCVAAMYFYGYPYSQDKDKASIYLRRLETLQSSQFDRPRYDGLACSGWINRGLSQ